jgi:ribosome-associated protein
MLVVSSRLQIPLREFDFSYARSAGPGGQNVNKVSTKAVLRWSPSRSSSLSEDVRRRLIAKYGHRITAAGDLLITSQRFRDAGRNTADCLEKLRQMLLAVAEPPAARRPSKPTRGSIRRRLAGKRQQSQKKSFRKSVGDE